MNTPQTKTQYLEKLQGLLRELFQFDSADLDFGFYAVMNQKREAISQFIEVDLLGAVADGLQHVAEQSQAEAQAAFQEARHNLVNTLGAGALDGDNLNPQFAQTPVGQAYHKAQGALNSAVIAEDMEAQIYNDLYAFFSRYYDDGDFISQRRYGQSDRYAIPYNGQEVHLHWANFDQYYVKTGIHFQNYSFTIPGGIGLDEGATIRVRLTKLDIPRDNVKGDKQFFIYAADQPTEWEEDSQTLIIPMEYRPLTPAESERIGGRNQQEKLLQEAHDAILQAVSQIESQTALRARLLEPDRLKRTDKGRLAYHLNRYAAENTRDFFVHKDLEDFLQREFDYYLKAEVLRLEDIDFGDSMHARRAATRLKTTRAIGEKIITFLDQLERFQRQLFLKRKFILQSDYCLTLDKIPADERPSFYPEILANERQLAEWRDLYGVTITSETDLDTQPHLMLDTAFFAAPIKARLLACFDDLDAACDGMLVHSDNSQALSLLLPRYRQQVKCFFIDPPYNTGSGDFVYKDEYMHSSWASMMHSRLIAAHSLMHPKGVMWCTLDSAEAPRFWLMCEQVFGEDQFVGHATWQHSVQTKGYAGKLASSHNNVFGFAKSEEFSLGVLERTEEHNKAYSNPDNDPKGPWRTGYLVNSLYRPNLIYDVTTPSGKVIKPPRNGWRYSKETMNAKIESGEIVFSEDETRLIRKIYLKDQKGHVPSSVWLGKDYGTSRSANRELKKLLPENNFETAKPVELVSNIVTMSVVEDDAAAVILDFFAGSGTTAHAVMNLNREDGGTRKYVLVEMGDHFDTVLIPRIQKVAYADEWKHGEPLLPSSSQAQLISIGQSHMFHYVGLESYDDTFHNVRFCDLSGPQSSLLSDMPDYFLSYVLDHETAGSPTLLDIEQFDHPFDYQLLVTDQDGVLGSQAVDLMATFNFLLGLAVQTIRRYEYAGNAYVRVTGLSPEGKQVCILWRNVLPVEQLDGERDWVLAEVLNGVDYDKLYVNGENTVPGALLIEEEFKRRMFEGVR